MQPEHGRPKCMYRLLFANDFWHVLGSRSYVSGLLIDAQVVALLGLRSYRDLISGQVGVDHLGRQTLGAQFFRSMHSIYRELLCVASAQTPIATSSPRRVGQDFTRA